MRLFGDYRRNPMLKDEKERIDCITCLYFHIGLPIPRSFLRQVGLRY